MWLTAQAQATGVGPCAFGNETHDGLHVILSKAHKKVTNVKDGRVNGHDFFLGPPNVVRIHHVGVGKVIRRGNIAIRVRFKGNSLASSRRPFACGSSAATGNFGR